MKFLDFIFFTIVVGLALTFASIVSSETLSIPSLQQNPLREPQMEHAVLYWSPFIGFIRNLIHIILPAAVGVWIIRFAEYHICKKPAPIETRYIQIWILFMMGISYFRQLSLLMTIAVYGTIIISALYVMFYQFHRAPRDNRDIW